MSSRKLVKIHNVRLGFATNSSSTHSIVMVPKKSLSDDYSGDGFGWQDFILVSAQNKDMYLAATLYSSLYRVVGPDIAAAVVENWTSVKNIREDPESDFDALPSIDHQSLMAFPLDWQGRGTHKGFFKAFREFIMRDDVAILGGNDNSEGHYLFQSDEVINTNHMGLPTESSPLGLVAREDNGYWVVFNRNTGAKVRLSFDSPLDFTPTRALTPELIDLKITDYCTKGCAYCYQNSTPKGRHVQMRIIETLARAFGQMQVFEVAIGGGEPTDHPEFVEILKVFRENNVVPNFTTRSMAWLEDETRRKSILEHAGSFAYSVQNAAEAEEVVEFCRAMNVPINSWGRRGLTLQYVMGTGSKQDFEDILKVASSHWMPVTLLGYKTVGRGERFAPKDHDDWLKTAIELQAAGDCPKLGIDTKLVQQYKEEIEAAGINRVTYHDNEGKFSMYIDAVNGLVGPSSYCDSSEMKMLEFESDYLAERVIRNHFESF